MANEEDKIEDKEAEVDTVVEEAKADAGAGEIAIATGNLSKKNLSKNW